MALDRAERGADKAAREAAHARASLLTPVAKAFSSDIGVEVASLGVQVHGGMGFIEETGAAQLYRDARIAPIYEGTNGIQAIDLVTRKLPLAGGTAVETYIGELRRIVEAVNAINDPALGLDRACGSKMRSTAWRGPRRGCWPSSRGMRRRRWPARRPICGCSRLRAAAACWPSRRSRHCGSTSTPRRASRWRGSLPRISRCRPAALERTVVEGAGGVLGADAALAG